MQLADKGKMRSSNRKEKVEGFKMKNVFSGMDHQQNESSWTGKLLPLGSL